MVIVVSILIIGVVAMIPWAIVDVIRRIPASTTPDDPFPIPYGPLPGLGDVGRLGALPPDTDLSRQPPEDLA